MSTNKSIFKSASIIGAATLFSRILGFVRDVVIALVFGTGPAIEAFLVAFRIPNMLREMIGEGAMNAAFVPVLNEYLVKKEKDDFWRLVNIVLRVGFIILAVLTMLGIIFSPLIVRLIAPGFFSDPQKFSLTVRLNRIMFPYLILIGLTAYSMGILNTFKSFFMPAFAPAVLNIVMILAVWASMFGAREPVIILAIGVLVGGTLNLLMQLPPLFKHGMRFVKLDNLNEPGANRMLKLLMPRMIGSGVYQLNLFADTICASLVGIVGPGAVAAIYYANRIIQLPLGLFGVSIANAALPTMSGHVAKNDLEALKSTVSFSLKSIFLVSIPSAVGIMILSGQIIKVLFQRGHFDAYSAQITSFALLFYSIGLIFYAGTKIILSCFYSLQDTITPVKVSAIALAINVVLNVVLMFPMKVGGLALATSISAMFNFFSLFFLLNKRIGRFNDKELMFYFLRVLAASLVMALGIYLTRRFLIFNLNQILALAILIAAGLVSFIAGCFIFKIDEIGRFSKWILKKK